MEPLLVKIFATALALSQVTTLPDAVKTRFERTVDEPRVAELLRAGCTHMRKAFDIEDINLDELISTAMDRDGDEDLFRISAEAGASLLFQVDAEKYGSLLDSSLALLDAQGKVLASNDDAKWLGRALNRDAMISFKFKESGDYFVKVSSLFRRGGPDHFYRLTVRPAAPDFMAETSPRSKSYSCPSWTWPTQRCLKTCTSAACWNRLWLCSWENSAAHLK